jgi:hypothetical protein
MLTDRGHVACGSLDDAQNIPIGETLMRFVIYVTLGVEVVSKAFPQADRSVYHQAESQTGIWHIDMGKFARFLVDEFAGLSFGSSIEEFAFGFEIASLAEWDEFFMATRDYVSYRPKRKQLLSVGQVEWNDVKELSPEEQLPFLTAALMRAIERLPTARRKPKDFDSVAFADATRTALLRCTAAMVAA